MLIILIPIACVVLVLTALMMCRLAAHSDRSETHAWSEWLAAAARHDTDAVGAESSIEGLSVDRPFRARRATG